MRKGTDTAGLLSPLSFGEELLSSSSNTDTPRRRNENGNLVLPNKATGLELLGRRWVPQLMFLLADGDARFNELADAIPMSRRVLNERLRELAAEGVLVRTVEAGPPTRITYRLSERGARLTPLLEQLVDWPGDRD